MEMGRRLWPKKDSLLVSPLMVMKEGSRKIENVTMYLVHPAQIKPVPSLPHLIDITWLSLSKHLLAITTFHFQFNPSLLIPLPSTSNSQSLESGLGWGGRGASAGWVESK
jgi:hypothetical protein